MKKILIVITLLSLVSGYSYAQSAKKNVQRKVETTVQTTTVVPALSEPDQTPTVIDTRNQPVVNGQPQLSTVSSSEALSIQPVKAVKEPQQNNIKKDPVKK